MTGSSVTVVLLLIYYGISIRSLRGLRLRTKNLALCGIIISLTLILDSIRIPLPTGATMSLCSPVPLLLLAIVGDRRLAILSGWVCGLLAMFLIPVWQPVHWGQVFCEHLVCFSCLGYAGSFGSDDRRAVLGGLILASAIKICGHTLSGVLFFSQNAWEGWSAWSYSLGYNLSQNIPLCLICSVIVLSLPLQTLKRAIGTEGSV